MTLQVGLIIFISSSAFCFAELFDGWRPIIPSIPNLSEEATKALTAIKNAIPALSIESNHTSETLTGTAKTKREIDERKLQLRDDDDSAERFSKKRRSRKYWRRKPKIQSRTEFPVTVPVNPAMISTMETVVQFPSSGDTVIKAIVHRYDDKRASLNAIEQVSQGCSTETLTTRGFYLTISAKEDAISTKVRKMQHGSGISGSSSENIEETGRQEYPGDTTKRNVQKRMIIPCMVVEMSDQQNQERKHQQVPIKHQRYTNKTGNFTKLANVTEVVLEGSNESAEAASSIPTDPSEAVVENDFTTPKISVGAEPESSM